MNVKRWSTKSGAYFTLTNGDYGTYTAVNPGDTLTIALTENQKAYLEVEGYDFTGWKVYDVSNGTTSDGNIKEIQTETNVELEDLYVIKVSYEDLVNYTATEKSIPKITGTDDAVKTYFLKFVPCYEEETVEETMYSLVISDMENGAVTSDRDTAKEGDTVILTAAPSEGYELSALTVTDAAGNEILLTANGDGTYSFAMPASDVVVKAEFKETEDPGTNGSDDTTDNTTDNTTNNTTDSTTDNTTNTTTTTTASTSPKTGDEANIMLWLAAMAAALAGLAATVFYTRKRRYTDK